MRFGIVVGEWNAEITEAMCESTIATLIKYGADEAGIIKQCVPGSFELPLAAQFMAESRTVDAVICLGCIIQGETKHFDFIAESGEVIHEINQKFTGDAIISKGDLKDFMRYSKPNIDKVVLKETSPIIPTLWMLPNLYIESTHELT